MSLRVAVVGLFLLTYKAYPNPLFRQSCKEKICIKNQYLPLQNILATPLSVFIICEKARAINANLVKDDQSASDHGESFGVNNGRFHIFEARTGVHSRATHIEAAIVDKWKAK